MVSQVTAAPDVGGAVSPGDDDALGDGDGAVLADGTAALAVVSGTSGDAASMPVHPTSISAPRAIGATRKDLMRQQYGLGG
ncbi:hypothetical protein DEA06_03785 [Microbacterium sp. Gd 4-13]|nr:hypothetical protein DEA06_03785 [Microbacterium sp. Gd 4-13]